MVASVAFLAQPAAVRAALSPLRQRLLRRLRQPGSASELAGEFDLPRQKINYHLRVLEAAGLLELTEERQRRGCIERVLIARAQAFVVDPSLMGTAPAPAARVAAQDRLATNRVLNLASSLVRDVATMQAKADAQDKRLLTFAIESDVTLAAPDDFDRLSSALADAVATVAARFNSAKPGARRYRVVVAGHPAPARRQERIARV